jgi:hypothetical protein
MSEWVVTGGFSCLVCEVGPVCVDPQRCLRPLRRRQVTCWNSTCPLEALARARNPDDRCLGVCPIRMPRVVRTAGQLVAYRPRTGFHAKFDVCGRAASRVCQDHVNQVLRNTSNGLFMRRGPLVEREDCLVLARCERVSAALEGVSCALGIVGPDQGDNRHYQCSNRDQCSKPLNATTNAIKVVGFVRTHSFKFLHRKLGSVATVWPTIIDPTASPPRVGFENDLTRPPACGDSD